MCLSCFTAANAPAHAVKMNRRNLLQALSVAGTVLPFTASAAGAAPTAARENQPSNWQDELETIIAKAKPAELVAFKKFKISGSDLPWLDLGISATPGQQVTFLLDGRMWLSRDSISGSSLVSYFTHARAARRKSSIPCPTPER